MPNPYAPVSTSVGDYLKAIWMRGGGETVTTTILAEHLGISPASVSGMLVRLQGTGLIDYQRYRGVRLTARGRREAMRLIRRHRLIETFMIAQLGYSWNEVHSEAETLEHAISDRFAERLAQLLGYPSHDPHGDPIPNPDGTLPATPNTPLVEAVIQQRLRVARLLTQDPEVLAYMTELGIEPGREIRILERDQIGGLLHAEVDGAHQVLSLGLAKLILGEVLS